MTKSLTLPRLALVLCAVATLTPVVAAPAAEVPSARIHVADLNLDSLHGQRVLQRRIDVAINKVCVRPVSRMAPSARVRQQVSSCREQAVTSVQAQLASRGIAQSVAFDLR